MLKLVGGLYWYGNRWYVEMSQALTKRTSDSGRTSSVQPASTSASSAFGTLMSSSAKHQLAATATSDKQKDGSSQVGASTTVSKDLDAAGHVSEQLVKQVEVNYSPNFTIFFNFFYLFYMQQGLCCVFLHPKSFNCVNDTSTCNCRSF